jgi:hypothetical protein
VTIDGVRALSDERTTLTSSGSASSFDALTVVAANMPAGYHNLTYYVASQLGATSATPTKAALLTSCAPGLLTSYKVTDAGPWGGYFGRAGETCAPCPAGAICVGFDTRRGPQNVVDPGVHMYPIPVIGFYNMNTSDALTSGMDAACPPAVAALFPGRKDVCIVRCDPPEACLGDNVCAPQYTSDAPYYRCATCARGFYKRATTCVKCPDSVAAVVVVAILIILGGGGVAYFLNKARINIACKCRRGARARRRRRVQTPRCPAFSGRTRAPARARPSPSRYAPL